MAYELHIERLGEDKRGQAIPIALDEWKAAVSATTGVRLCTPGVRKFTYPHGASINIPIRDGDVEVYFPEEQAWEPVFHWLDGSASVNASFDLGDTVHPVWSAMVALASRLGAARVGMMESATICRQVKSLKPNKPDGANRRQSPGLRELVGEFGVLAFTAAVAHPSRSAE